MRVLWVCNIMLPVVAQQLGVKGSNKEGWLDGLCRVLLERWEDNAIELHVAFPVERSRDGYAEEIRFPNGSSLHCYGFYENVNHAEDYDESLEVTLRRIIEQVQPEVIHCFGTEYAHSLAVVRCAPFPERVLVGIQGVCGAIAGAYMADLPLRVQNGRTFRDWLKKDGMQEQQQKFVLRGKREAEILRLAQNVTGRTAFDRSYAEERNPHVRYFPMNETLRSCFYEGQWKPEECERHSIFVSQGDYPLKGLHYMLLAVGKLREKYPDVKVYVAGNSLVRYETLKDKIKISAYGKYLRRLIEKYSLQACVQFTGSLTAEEMKERYLKSHLYVCCSSNENSPNSLGEAMLLGVPCVAAAVGGIPSLFDDGRDGILYSGHANPTNILNNTCDTSEKVEETAGTQREQNSVEWERDAENQELCRIAQNLYHAVDTMWENPAQMAEFCTNARLHARKTHNQEDNYRKMTEIYARIAEQ